MHTPTEVSNHLINVLRDAAKELQDSPHIDHTVLVLGLTDILAELVDMVPDDDEKKLLKERVLHGFIQRTGGTLLVMHRDREKGH